MRIINQIDAAIMAKMTELKVLAEAKERVEKHNLAKERGEDKTFWKDGFVTIRSVSKKRTVIRRREVG